MWPSKKQHQHQSSDTTISQHSSSLPPVSKKTAKLGPPQYIKSRPYSPILEFLERQCNLGLIAEYENDIYSHYVTLEQVCSVNPKMIDLQPEIEWYMRPYLLDFLIEMHSSFKLRPQTLFLCLDIIDRYCSKRIVFKQHYQLIGCTAMWIAAKYEDKKSRTPTLRELSMMCRNVYDENMFKEMEMHILSTLEWHLGHISLEDCLQLSIRSAKKDSLLSTPQHSNSKSIENAIIAISRYLCELSLFQRSFLLYPTSLIAVTAHLIACSLINDSSAAKLLLGISEEYDYDNQFGDIKSALHRKQTSHMDLFGNYSSSEDEDEEMYDEDSENTKPAPKLPFLSGFVGSKTIVQIRQLSLLFINAINNPSEILVNKYTPLGVINVVNGFLQRNYQILQHSLPLLNSSDLKIEEMTASSFTFPLNQLSDLLLGISAPSSQGQTFTQPQPVKSAPSYSPSLPPLTPSSSNSQYSSSSIFSSGMKTPTGSTINIKNFNSRQNSIKQEYNILTQQSKQQQHGKKINYPNSSPVADVPYPSSPVEDDNYLDSVEVQTHERSTSQSTICYRKYPDDPVSSPLSHNAQHSMIY